MAEDYRYGIDLGTTNSCVAAFAEDHVTIFDNRDRLKVTPSAVRITRSGAIVVGKRAYEAIVTDPLNVATEFKRWMGQSDIKRFPGTGQALSAEQLSAEVLKSLRAAVQAKTSTDMTSAVITVPAAFGMVQREATSKAARLAGLQHSVLLHEPIAAAIAYGVGPSRSNQKWLVFDLGGGTFDVAIVSTKDDFLTVIEHFGQDTLGGKDVDRRIVDNILWPALASEYKLPNPIDHPDKHQPLVRRALFRAEELKIELSDTRTAICSFFDIGEDLEGKVIELDIPVSREQLEQQFEPTVTRCIELMDKALSAAHLAPAELTNVLLVGGPTKSPYLREALRNHLKVPLNDTLDPMTIVAAGAAIYAASLELKRVEAPTNKSEINLKLAYDRVSRSLETEVLGTIDTPPKQSFEVRMDEHKGFWSSGWVPIKDNKFCIAVSLQERKTSLFHIYLRDQSGKLIEADPNEFSIRHGLEPNPFPLPHSISIEFVDENDQPRLDPIFGRSTLLPASKEVSYRVAVTLKPSSPTDSVSIKLWEGEDFSTPQANNWINLLTISGSMLSKPLPRGSEIKIHFHVDRSSLLTVGVTIPRLDQHFTEGIYLPDENGRSNAEGIIAVSEQLDTLNQRLKEINRNGAISLPAEQRAEIKALRKDLDHLYLEVHLAGEMASLEILDTARKLQWETRRVSELLSKIEELLNLDSFEAQLKQAKRSLRTFSSDIQQHGDDSEKETLSALVKDLNVIEQNKDLDALHSWNDNLSSLNYEVLSKHDWFWRDIFNKFDRNPARYTNQAAMSMWFQTGDKALSSGSGRDLRKAVEKLWDLEVKDVDTAAREQSIPSHLRLT
ncbi:MAG TPA: Hsp70 family protein [Fimbriimonadaceae bacterium]|jgi:molecular chaperone DnaK